MTERPAAAAPEPEPEAPEVTPEEEAQLLAAARRAREDLAAGRVYRVDESFLERLAAAAAAAERPLTRAEVAAFVDVALARGEIERAVPAPSTASTASTASTPGA
jgi:hypothetical protein